jgi:two-component system, cell cycle sensor histidine kinase and response regulator CckA
MADLGNGQRMSMLYKFLDLEQERGENAKDMLFTWRKRLFLSIFICSLVAAFIPLLLNIKIAITSGNILNAVVFSAIYIAAIFVTFGKFIPFEIRAWSGLLLFYLMGIVSLASVGLGGGGRMFLFMFAVLTTLILGLRPGIVALALNLLTMFLWLWACSSNYFSLGLMHPFLPSQLLAIGFTFLFMNAVVTVSIGIFVTALKKGFEKEQNLSKELKGSNEKLLMENEERKRTQDALRESEQQYRLLADNVNDMIWLMDIEQQRVTYISPSVIKMRKYTPAEVMEQSLEDMLTPASYKRAVKTLANELMVDGEMDPDRSVTMELEQYQKDGNTIWTEIAASFVRDEEKRPIAILGVTRDITERIKSEEDKKKLQKQLQNSQKMEAIGTLAGGIAHDFNNLLMAIQSRTSMILMNKKSSHPDLEHLKGIEAHVESATALTRQLLGFARGGKYEVKPTDLNELVKKQNRLFGRTKKEITVRGKYEKDLWSADVDRGQIEQVLLNLYVNAWQVMPGGGNLYLATENVTLDEYHAKPFSVKPGRYVKISITDTGIGMDQTIQERIFDPFFTTKEPGRGTGLGLASAYGIIKNHGGVINVNSEKGEGTTFNIYLPASEKEVVLEQKSTGHILKGFETVLFVDDEEMITEVAKELLELLGYKALIARSGKEAIRIYEENKKRIGMVILDMIMPDMNGGEAYDRMKDINPNVKVLLSSGYSTDGRVDEILDRGCNGFIQKPFKIKEFSQKMREILDEK